MQDAGDGPVISLDFGDERLQGRRVAHIRGAVRDPRASGADGRERVAHFALSQNTLTFGADLFRRQLAVSVL